MGGSSIGERRASVTRGVARSGSIGALAALLSLLGGSCAPPRELGPVQLSLLAVGDTGAPPRDLKHYAQHRAVARAMAAEDREHPFHALVLLGDNFYPTGLGSEELAQRVRANLVLPLCRFVELGKPTPPAVTGACAAPAGARHPIPLYAILGNHDHDTPGSPELQREAVSRIVPNWQMAAGESEVYSLGSGVDLIAFDSTPVFRGGSAAALREALRRAKGPWRIVAAHHPIAVPGHGAERQRTAAYRERMLEAVAAAGVTVHLVLSGHEHNLQLLAMDPPAPALHVVSGGGSGARSIRDEAPHRLAGFEAPGYARIDLAGEGTEARLVASLYRVPALPLRLARDRILAARWSVDRDGRVREE